jgi:hypothetical protein
MGGGVCKIDVVNEEIAWAWHERRIQAFFNDTGDFKAVVRWQWRMDVIAR